MHIYLQGIVYLVAAILLGSAVVLSFQYGHHEAWYRFSGIEFLTILALAGLAIGVATFAIGAIQPDKNIRPKQ